jgi:hypothetical protein
MTLPVRRNPQLRSLLTDVSTFLFEGELGCFIALTQALIRVGSDASMIRPH